MAFDAHVVWMPGGVRTEIHLTALQTGGAFCLLVDHPPVGWSLAAHLHQNEAETIHIVEGEFEMEVDGARSRLSAGETIYVPRGVIHSGANIGRQSGRRVLLLAPPGWSASSPKPAHPLLTPSQTSRRCSPRRGAMAGSSLPKPLRREASEPASSGEAAAHFFFALPFALAFGGLLNVDGGGLRLPARDDRHDRRQLAVLRQQRAPGCS